MEEKVEHNRNLLAALIALIILVVVAVFYWDRQKQRDLRLQRTQAEIQGELLEELGPQAQQQVQAAFGAQTVAFSKQISYKNIVARIAPSVVSVNVSSAFINQGGPVVQAQPAAQNQPADQSQEATGMGQYVWGGRMGGLGGSSRWFCPNCYTNVPCRRGIAASGSNCPSCGIRMMHGCTPWACPLGAQSQQPARRLKTNRQTNRREYQDLDNMSGGGEWAAGAWVPEVIWSVQAAVRKFLTK